MPIVGPVHATTVSNPSAMVTAVIVFATEDHAARRWIGHTGRHYHARIEAQSVRPAKRRPDSSVDSRRLAAFRSDRVEASDERRTFIAYQRRSSMPPAIAIRILLRSST